MIAGLDSSSCPTPTQVAAAARAGVRMWSGYLATLAHVGLYNVWPRSAFDVARQAGATPLAFCSGWDSPGACKAQAAAWNVRLCLDVEGGIRPDGSWVQPWLAASGAGLYGNAPVHVGRTAAFHVLAAYQGDPGATWAGPPPAPGVPCGWQWRGTHSEFGISVDRGWYDDWFGGQDDMDVTDPNFQALIWRVAVLTGNVKAADVPAAAKPYVVGVLALPDVKAELDAIKAQLATIQGPGTGALTDAQAGELSGVLAILTRIENSLKAA